jgi:DNA-binding phage protein
MEFDETLRLEKFRKGLRLVVQSIGTTKLAAAKGIHRVILYRMLAKGGNPSLENLMRILVALDLRIWILEHEFFERKARVVRPKDY